MKKILLTSLVSFLLLFGLTANVSASEFYSANVGYQVETSAGWQDFAYGGALAGNEGLEALKSVSIHLVDAPYNASIEYRVYTSAGWQAWATSFAQAGSGENILGVQVRLDNYPNASVHYQSYRDDLGWGTWVQDGKTSGTLNVANPITGLRVKVFEYGVKYQSETNGNWLSVRHNGETLSASKLDSVRLGFESEIPGVKLSYRAYFKNEGWTDWVSNWTTLGGNGKTLEALEAKVEGTYEYHVAIQPYISGTGWVDWAYDGATAGIPGVSLEAYRIKIEKKVYVAPVVTAVVSAPVVVGGNPNVMSLTYDIVNTSDADDDFDDNPANRVIVIGDRFRSVAYISSFVDNGQIPVPATFSGPGDDQVHGNQFEVFYGTYDNTTFTVQATPGTGTPSNIVSPFTLVLYDNDSSSTANVVDGFLVQGLKLENKWFVVNAGTPNAYMTYRP